jgi:hypothetical protein
MQRLGVLGGAERPAPDPALDDLDVEPDLLLERTDLTLGRAPHAFDRVTEHGVVDAADESGDAHDPLEVDRDDVERRPVVAVGPDQLERELVGERGLARVARSEQRDVRLTLQRERHLVGERIHPDDLRRIIERAVPDERVQRSDHGGDCTA